MSTLALNSVQQGLYSKLIGDGVLMDMIAGVFDAVPERTAMPYIIIGDGVAKEAAALESASVQCELVIDVWTDAAGRKTALTIMNRIYGLLHQGTLSLSGFEVILMRCEEAATRLEPDGPHMRGEMLFSALVRVV